jgi:hypothetical protein
VFFTFAKPLENLDRDSNSKSEKNEMTIEEKNEKQVSGEIFFVLSDT